jgi:hypothetical protein
MSFKLGLTGIQELLVMGLMIVLVFAMFSNMELSYKIGIGALVFALIFLTSIASQLFKQAEDRKRL